MRWTRCGIRGSFPLISENKHLQNEICEYSQKLGGTQCWRPCLSVWFRGLRVRCGQTLLASNALVGRSQSDRALNAFAQDRLASSGGWGTSLFTLGKQVRRKFCGKNCSDKMLRIYFRWGAEKREQFTQEVAGHAETYVKYDVFATLKFC